MRLASLSLTLAVLTLPLQAGAMSITPFDFRGQPPEGWQAQGVQQVVPLPEGIRIVSSAGGGITKNGDVVRGAQSVKVFAQTNVTVQGVFAWHAPGTPADEIPQLPFTIEASETMREIPLALSNYPQWTGDADFIGIGLAEEGDIVLERLEFRGYSFLDTLEELVTGFWTFDEFRPYSINFLWGPLLSYTPEMRASLYDTLPPFAHSATQWMYVLLGIAAAAWIVLSMRGRGALGFGVLCATFIGLWLLFDLRMGSEIVTYAMRDLRSYALAPEGQKQLRTHEYYFDVLNQALPELQKHERFGLLTDENAFYSLTRYRAYPSLPITPSNDQKGLTLWLVAYRPDAVVDAQGKLSVGGKVLAESGKIVKELPGGSFLYSTKP